MSLRRQFISAQADIDDAEARLRQRPERSGTKDDESLIKSLESRAGDERLRRKSLENEYDKLSREFDEVDRAYERELERREAADAELRRVSRQERWRRTALVGGSSDHMDVDKPEVGSGQLSALREETEALKTTLAELDRHLAKEDEACARLVLERDLQRKHCTTPRSSTPVERKINLTPAMLDALATLENISLSVAQAVEHTHSTLGPPARNTNSSPPRPLKRQYSVSFD